MLIVLRLYFNIFYISITILLLLHCTAIIVLHLIAQHNHYLQWLFSHLAILNYFIFIKFLIFFRIDSFKYSLYTLFDILYSLFFINSYNSLSNSEFLTWDNISAIYLSFKPSYLLKLNIFLYNYNLPNKSKVNWVLIQL